MTKEVKQEEPKKAGRPHGSRGRTRSKLRKTEASLLKMNDSAVEVIQRSLDGEEIEPNILATAKWVVNASVTVSRAAIAEETTINADRMKQMELDAEEEAEYDEDNGRAAFSLTVVS